MSPRATDQKPGPGRTLHIWWQRLGRDVVTMFAVGLAAWSVFVVQGEGARRRDQTCRLFERQAATAVDRLTQTYAYLARLTPEQRREPINVAVIAQLRTTEQDAKTSAAPTYCDEAGVGLPEPNRRIPKRPSSLP